ncbi:MAG: site-2 protease family protein [Patescibacteria group bacterium]
MLFNALSMSPQAVLVSVLAVVYALTVHEFSHAWAAYSLGDPTARYQGRLTLNPLAHLEFFGTLMLLLAGFGWGKPVPVNVYNLRWRKWGETAVSLAGPVANFVSVIFFIIIYNILYPFLPANNLLSLFLLSLILINLVLGVFNLIPLPPLDGSKVLFAVLSDRYADFKHRLAVNGPWILLALILLDNFAGINIFGHIFSFFINLISFFIK